MYALKSKRSPTVFQNVDHPAETVGADLRLAWEGDGNLGTNGGQVDHQPSQRYGYPRPKPPAGSINANYHGFIEPALATSIDKVPSGKRWIHEIKNAAIIDATTRTGSVAIATLCLLA